MTTLQPPTRQPHRVLLASAVRRPAMIGAFAPSSPALARLLASVVPSHGVPVVVELGAGTGAITRELHARLPDEGQLLSIEADPTLAEYVRATQPAVDLVTADACRLDELLRGRGTPHVDAIISGLPWALFDQGKQDRLLDQIGRVLAPGGVFTTFSYLHAARLPAARRFRSALAERFDEVIESRTVWRNLPPARSYVCRRFQDHA